MLFTLLNCKQAFQAVKDVIVKCDLVCNAGRHERIFGIVAHFEARQKGELF